MFPSPLGFARAAFTYPSHEVPGVVSRIIVYGATAIPTAAAFGRPEESTGITVEKQIPRFAPNDDLPRWNDASYAEARNRVARCLLWR